MSAYVGSSKNLKDLKDHTHSKAGSRGGEWACRREGRARLETGWVRFGIYGRARLGIYGWARLGTGKARLGAERGVDPTCPEEPAAAAPCG